MSDSRNQPGNPPRTHHRPTSILLVCWCAIAILFEVLLDVPADWTISLEAQLLESKYLDLILIAIAGTGTVLGLLAAARILKAPFWLALCVGVTNGVLLATAAVTMAPASFNPALNYLGNSQYDTDPIFNGRLDELFIYNYALTDVEITRLAANLPPPPTTPTNLSLTAAGSVFNFAWPSNYVGCRLESNSVGLTAAGSWFKVPGSATTNQLALPIDDSSSNVFFRLVYP